MRHARRRAGWRRWTGAARACAPGRWARRCATCAAWAGPPGARASWPACATAPCSCSTSTATRPCRCSRTTRPCGARAAQLMRRPRWTPVHELPAGALWRLLLRTTGTAQASLCRPAVAHSAAPSPPSRALRHGSYMTGARPAAQVPGPERRARPRGRGRRRARAQRLLPGDARAAVGRARRRQRGLEHRVRRHAGLVGRRAAAHAHRRFSAARPAAAGPAATGGGLRVCSTVMARQLPRLPSTYLRRTAPCLDVSMCEVWPTGCTCLMPRPGRRGARAAAAAYGGRGRARRQRARARQGHVVGFSGSRVYCLQQAGMLSLDVPHSATLARFLAAPDFRRAYQARARGPPCTLFWARSVGYSISASGSTCTASGLLMLCGAAARPDTWDTLML